VWFNSDKRNWLDLEFSGNLGFGVYFQDIKGEVAFKNEYQRPPSVIIPFFPSRPTHILQLKVLLGDGSQIAVVFEGDLMGVVEIGDQVQVKGYNKGGNIKAISIFNSTTNSYVAKG